MSDPFDLTLDIEFSKRSDELRLVGGFAYVSKRDGKEMVDLQGDSIPTSVLREAVHEFMKTRRDMGIMHIVGPDGKPVAAGEVVEMAVFGDGFSPPGMEEGTEGLWVVAKVNDQEVWNLVKSGLLRGFSIGGKGSL